MAWRVQIRAKVMEGVNGLAASGALSRVGMVLSYNSLRLELPRQVRRFQASNYAHDPAYFLYPARLRDRGVWHRCLFYVNDAVEPGLLVVEDMDHEVSP
jgi:hypothetical protein